MFGLRSKSPSSLSDEELIRAYRKNGKKALVGELFERYSHLVFGVCLKYLKDEASSKDAVINIFEKLMTDLKRHEIQQFRSWLFRVARNHCLMVLREQQARMRRDEAVKAEFTSQPDPEDIGALEEKELEFQRLEQAIEGLKEEQKICIRLFYLEQKCYNEVADITGFTLKQVKSYIQNGKRNLRISLTSHHESTAAR